MLVDREYVKLVDTDDDDDDTESNVRGTGGTPSGQVRISDPETELSITDKGIRSVLEQADEDWRPETEKHNEVIRRAFVMLSATGMEVTVVHQDHEMSLPDAVAYPPIDESVDTKRASRLLEQFKADYPIAAELSGGGAITIEAETSTYKKPARTLQNLARSVRNGRKAMFITPEEGTDKSAELAARVNHILTDPMLIRGHLRMRPNEDAEDAGDLSERDPMPLYYNKTDFLDLGTPTDGQRKHALIEKRKQAVWVNTDDNQITLFNGMTDGAKKGTLRMDEGFGSTNAFNAWCRYDEYNNEWVVYPDGEPQRYRTLGDLRDDWQLVYEPFVPEREFEEMPTEDDWDIIQTPLPEFLSPTGEADDDETDPETKADDEEVEEPVDGDEDGEAEPPDGTYENIEDIPEQATLDKDTEEDTAPDDEDENDISLERAGFTREAVPILESLVPSKMPGRDSDVSGAGSKPGSNTAHEAPPEAFESMVPEKHMPVYRALAALDVEAPAFYVGGRGPCYVPDRGGNDEYVNVPDSDYNFR